MSAKIVTVSAYEFDVLPAHIQIRGRGTGASLRVGLQRAVADVLRNHVVHKRHIRSFKMSVVVSVNSQDAVPQ